MEHIPSVCESLRIEKLNILILFIIVMKKSGMPLQVALKKNNLNYIQNNRLLLKIKARALKVYADLDFEKEYFNLDDFSQRFRIDSNPENDYVFPFWKEIISEMKLAGRMGNSTMYEETMKSINQFCEFKKIRFQDITNSFLNKIRSMAPIKRWNGWWNQYKAAHAEGHYTTRQLNEIL